MEIDGSLVNIMRKQRRVRILIFQVLDVRLRRDEKMEKGSKRKEGMSD